MDTSRFTPKAEQAIRQAHECAAQLGHGYVGSEHLLLGLCKETAGSACHILREHGVLPERLKARVVETVGQGASAAPAQGLTPRVKRIIEIAHHEARRLGHAAVGTEHLLMGILHEQDSIAGRLLADSGADTRQLYTALTRRIGAPDGDAPAAPPYPSPGVPFRAAPRPLSETKLLNQFGRDLTQMALSGGLDPVVGRGEEILRVLQVLSRRSKNNPVLVGEPGVGKTAVVEGLAQRVADAEVPEELRGARVVTLDLGGMVAGTKYRGEFEERFKSVLEEVKRAGNVVLFIDEMHTMIGAGAAEGAIDAANILKPALSRGEIQLIGATTLEEYRRHIERDAALERRFQPVAVDEPSEPLSVEILKGLRPRYEAHHRLHITDGAIEAAVRLGVRYLPDRRLPDKAIDLIDEAAARVRLASPASASPSPNCQLSIVNCQLSIGAEDVAAVASVWSGVPVSALNEDEAAKLLRLEETLSRRVVGQAEAVKAVAQAIRRGRAGIQDPRRPVGSFLFLGPTGVGKTELCRALAEAVYGHPDALIRVDMSEYMEGHSVSKLIGSPPGYVGYGESGGLTERVRRRPYAVVLFDELEKAHPDVSNLLLQILEDGTLRDAQGKRADFRHAIVVMTSNLGAKRIASAAPMGFRGELSGAERDKQLRHDVLAELGRSFRPEFLNRVDEILVFGGLNAPELRQIAERMLADVAARAARLGVTLTAEPSVPEALCAAAAREPGGARPLRRAIQTQVENELSQRLLQGAVKPGQTVRVSAENGAWRWETA
jgi:ATP-dependent Clp protease ATP-binding subunit ClpC